MRSTIMLLARISEKPPDDEGKFMKLQMLLDKEKEDLEKLLANLGKKIGSNYNDNSSHVSGSVEGISGTDN